MLAMLHLHVSPCVCYFRPFWQPQNPKDAAREIIARTQTKRVTEKLPAEPKEAYPKKTLAKPVAFGSSNPTSHGHPSTSRRTSNSHGRGSFRRGAGRTDPTTPCRACRNSWPRSNTCPLAFWDILRRLNKRWGGGFLESGKCLPELKVNSSTANPCSDFFF